MKFFPENHPAVARLREHQDQAVLLAGGGGAFALGSQWSEPPLPMILMGIALVLGLFAPFRKGGVAESWGALFTRNLKPVLGVIGVTGAVGRFAFGLDWPSLLFVPLWLGLILLLRVAFAPRAFFGSDRWVGRWARAIGRFFARLNEDRSLTLATILGGGLWVTQQCLPAGALAWWIAAAAPMLWLILDGLPFSRWQWHATLGPRLLAVAVRYAVWGLILILATGGFGGTPLGFWLVDLAALVALYLVLASVTAIGTAENARWLLVAVFGLILMHPLMSPNIEGAGDSAWYGLTMADVLSQAHHGVFPIFIGQSIFQFNGSYSPLRIAPLLQHLGLLVDLLTGWRLDPGVVLNLVLIGCGLGGGLTAYLALRDLVPQRRWMAALLAACYVGAPAVLAILYDEGLYMTWTTLPWIPLAFWGFLRTFDSRSLRPFLLMSLGLGLVWWGHAPVALWLTLTLFVGQCVRVWRDRRDRGAWILTAQTVGLLALLIAYPIISVRFVPADSRGNVELFAQKFGALTTRIVEVLQGRFLATFLPVRLHGRDMADFQLGWSLLVVLGFLVWSAIRRGGAVLYSVLGMLGFLLLFVVPVPGLLSFLWRHLPEFILGPTGDWAPTRLYPLLTAVVVFGAGFALRGLSARALQPALATLIVAVFWVGWEANVFVQAGRQDRVDAAAAGLSPLTPENIALSRYSYAIFGIGPPFFPTYSHGVVDPDLQQRLFALDGSTRLTDNTEAILAAAGSDPSVRLLGAGTLTLAPISENRAWSATPHFLLQPGHHYLLDLGFAHPETPGVLLVKGSTLSRVYLLPSYGGSEAFGSAPGASHALPLWVTSPGPQEVRLNFVTNAESTLEAVNPLGSYRWIEYSEEALPVKVLGWAPYTARVRSPAEGWLETPRVYLQDYAATVDGRSTPIQRSTSGLTLIRVPKGESRVQLRYAAPLKLTLSYYLSLLSIAVALWVLVRGWWPRGRSAG